MAIAKGMDSKLSWTQVETGSAITWKYPYLHPFGNRQLPAGTTISRQIRYEDDSSGQEYPQHYRQQRHLCRTERKLLSRSGARSPKADNARNYSQCDSLLLGDKCGAHTFPYMDIHNETAVVEHEATTSKISEDQIFYCNQRGISTEDAVGLIVNGYAKEVLNKLPMEFAVEAQKLLAISLEGKRRIAIGIQNSKLNIMLKEIKDLHASINGKEILKGINLTIRDGEVHALMGQNGAGKSTFLVLVGHPAFEVTRGSVTFYGKNLLEYES